MSVRKAQKMNRYGFDTRIHGPRYTHSTQHTAHSTYAARSYGRLVWKLLEMLPDKTQKGWLIINFRKSSLCTDAVCRNRFNCLQPPYSLPSPSPSLVHSLACSCSCIVWCVYKRVCKCTGWVWCANFAFCSAEIENNSYAIWQCECAKCGSEIIYCVRRRRQQTLA